MEEIKEEIVKIASMPECIEKVFLLHSLVDYIFAISNGYDFENGILDMDKISLN